MKHFRSCASFTNQSYLLIRNFYNTKKVSMLCLYMDQDLPIKSLAVLRIYCYYIYCQASQSLINLVVTFVGSNGSFDSTTYKNTKTILN